MVPLGDDAQIVFLKNAEAALELFQAEGESPIPAVEDDGPTYAGFRHMAFHVNDVKAKIEEIGDDTKVTLGPLDFGDFIEDKSAISPANATAYTMLKEQMDDVLSTLTEREKKVLRLRFGIGDGYPRTLEEVGSVFRVTRERVRQIEAKALRKLRHPTRSKKLKSFLSMGFGE